MSQSNRPRSWGRDVYHAYLVETAVYDGDLEIPWLAPETRFPDKLVPFSKAVHGADTNAWVHFYEQDAVFERLWNNPKKYLPILKRYAGVLTPDFSLFRDMPLIMQEWNIYRSRAVGHWLQENGIPVIPNVRWGDERTFETCCLGVPKLGTIAVGSHGCIKLLQERECFVRGLTQIVSKLQPHTIIVYGAAPGSVFDKYRKAGIRILQFDSDCHIAHHREVND